MVGSIARRRARSCSRSARALGLELLHIERAAASLELLRELGLERLSPRADDEAIDEELEEEGKVGRVQSRSSSSMR